MTEKKKEKTLLQKINEVMKEVTTVYKETKKVNNQYRFVSHDAVTKLLHEPLARHGIHMVPSVLDNTQEGNRTKCTVQLAFFNVDNAEDVIVMKSFGYGIDPQDKGPGKAYSYAVKMGLLKMFMLESSEEDNEAVLMDFKSNDTKKETNKNKKSFVAPTEQGW